MICNSIYDDLKTFSYINCHLEIIRIKEFIFLHASTFKTLSLRNLHYENSFEYLNNIRILADIITNIQDSKLLIRARDLDECSIETLHSSLKNYKNIQITKFTTLEEDLSQTDCLISYSSTVIEEAILVYCRH